MKTIILAALGLLAALPSGATAQEGKAILGASGVKGGLVVVIGCGRAELPAELRAGDSYLVRALDSDPAKVAIARKYLAKKGLYGPIAAARLTGSQLPYVDSLVNLIVVASDTPEIPREEMMRALAPLGVIADIRKGKVEITRKPWPENLDEWTHYLHNATNNAVSGDTTVGPPRGLRWTCGPKYARSHEHIASVSAMVTAAGRMFYIIDEGPISSVYMPPKWKLVARDAFSGVLLWKKPIADWESHLRGFRSGPPEIGRALVVRGEKVYVALGYAKPVAVLGAATGKELASLRGTGGTRELLLAGKRLYVLADDMTRQEYGRRKKWIDGTVPKLEIIWRFPRTPIRMYGTQRVVAINTDSGELIWKRQFKEPGEIMPTTLAVNAGKVCLQTVSHVVCLDAARGKELWRTRRPVATSRWSWSTPSLVVRGGVVLTIDRMAMDNAGKSPPAKGSKWKITSGGFETRVDAELIAFSLAAGKELWRAPYMENYNVPQDIFVINDVVWVGNLRRGVDTGFTQGRNLKTGKVTATIPPQKGWGHHRCYRNKATVRWIIMGRGGMQFVDPKGGTNRNVGWARGGCQYGVMPANGLIYTPQHSCACSPESLLAGLNALSPQSSAQKGPLPLEKGPVFGEVSDLKSGPARNQWPTYRRDARRSGYQDLAAPSEPGVAWTTKLGAPVTAPVSTGGMVFVAETERHNLCTLSAANGKRVWTFTADGRIDSPPTISGGLCLFGTRNGAVYCLRTSDGALVWRFGVSPRDRRIFSYGQIESVWPVHGSVLVDSGKVYFAAGRSSSSDGGIRLYALELKTGKVLSKTDVATGGGRGRADRISRRVLPDILSLQNGAIWMRGMGLDKNLRSVKDAVHLFAPRGFLDDTWWHRTYWVYGTKIGGGYTRWPDVGNAVPAGRLLTFDGGKLIYGYGRMAYRMGGGHVRADMTKGYKLFAEVLDPATATKKRRIKWTAQLPFVARSVVLTRDALLVAGGRSPTETAGSHGPGNFRIASREDGAKISACALPAGPVLDGMALTDAGVFISTINGTVVCLRAKK
ncbi:MAG: PQQ-binding-like beta-propeller repeat protein [Phycisphaerae bacterium]|jgi:outer membrane protein assembly factor BamB|nr:PQQ-binding-like beta-propeller repeat protein [Phycisphaerae bacterium]